MNQSKKEMLNIIIIKIFERILCIFINSDNIIQNYNDNNKRENKYEENMENSMFKNQSFVIFFSFVLV